MTMLNMHVRSTDRVFEWILPLCIYISHWSVGTRSHYSQEAWMEWKSNGVRQPRFVQFTIRNDDGKAENTSKVDIWDMEQVLTSVHIYLPLVCRYWGHYSQEAWMKWKSIVVSQPRFVQLTFRHDHGKAQEASQLHGWDMEQVLTSLNIYLPLVIRYMGHSSQEAWMKWKSNVVRLLRFVQFTIRRDHDKAKHASQINRCGIWMDLTYVHIYFSLVGRHWATIVKMLEWDAGQL